MSGVYTEWTVPHKWGMAPWGVTSTPHKNHRIQDEWRSASSFYLIKYIIER